MAFFDRFKTGLEKTKAFIFQNVQVHSEREGDFDFDEEMLEELEMILLRTDMGASFVDRCLSKVRRQMTETGDRKASTVFQILREETKAVLKTPRQLSLNPNRLNMILLVGVNGSGKTTTAGKLASRFIKEGHKVLLAAADTFRAAAIDQLRHWAEKTGALFVAQSEGSDPAAVVFDAIKAAKARQCNAILIDTAGRLQNKKNLMDELNKIRRVIDREAAGEITRTLIVIDATTGQNAILQAQTFAETSRVDGVCITKLDGSAKGGVAVAVAEKTGLPLYLAGLGEGVDDLVDFDVDRFVDSLLPSPEDFKA